MTHEDSHSSSAEIVSAKATYERYAFALRRYLTRRVSRREDVDDLTQEIFELFVRRKDRAEVIRNPLAYLFRIAFHVVGSMLADTRKSPVTYDSRLWTSDQALDVPSSSDQEAEELVVQNDIRLALAQLPRNHLQALILVDGQDMSHQEVARIMNCQPNTVAKYVMHGRAALKLALDGRNRVMTKDKG